MSDQQLSLQDLVSDGNALKMRNAIGRKPSQESSARAEWYLRRKCELSFRRAVDHPDYDIPSSLPLAYISPSGEYSTQWTGP